jgi:hypothetical protein
LESNIEVDEAKVFKKLLEIMEYQINKWEKMVFHQFFPFTLP